MSGYPIAIPTESATAHSALKCMLDIIAYFGIPKVFKSDRNPFSSILIKEKAKELGFVIQLNPAYQPEWVGAVERLNSTIRYALTKSIIENKRNWEKYLFGILYGLRTRISARTKESPYFMIFGVAPRLPLEATEPIIDNINSDLRKEELSYVQLLRRKKKQKERKGSVKSIFKIGDLVMLLNENLRKKNITSKFKVRYRGPYKIIKTFHHGMYQILDERKKKKLVHVSRLVEFHKGIQTFENGVSLGAPQLIAKQLI
ncbi:Retrovirus-related Pol polyprotein from transposon [Smittium culicis]|uniref:Retrovirus-related Pol polyprotein from transposon n=1 Tax=Smittium culicis TaxID=133412 RepID=A0A1R1XP83_9FUNG|nr:Retrovirus-related Pol polyprotein from transposon [Smittium culicis]